MVCVCVCVVRRSGGGGGAVCIGCSSLVAVLFSVGLVSVVSVVVISRW